MITEPLSHFPLPIAPKFQNVGLGGCALGWGPWGLGARGLSLPHAHTPGHRVIGILECMQKEATTHTFAQLNSQYLLREQVTLQYTIRTDRNQMHATPGHHCAGGLLLSSISLPPFSLSCQRIKSSRTSTVRKHWLALWTITRPLIGIYRIKYHRPTNIALGDQVTVTGERCQCCQHSTSTSEPSRLLHATSLFAIYHPETPEPQPDSRHTWESMRWRSAAQLNIIASIQSKVPEESTHRGPPRYRSTGSHSGPGHSLASIA